MKKRKGIKRFLAAMMAVALLVTGLPEADLSVSAATTSATNVEKVADPSTADSYTDMLGADVDGARYAGRIWVDKSVYDGEFVSLDGNNITNDKNFMVVYSALGSTTAASTQTTGTMDVVIVLDNSASMGRYTNTSTKYTRLEAVTDAANELLKDILASESSRVAVVTYSTRSDTLLPLDHYDLASGKTNYLSVAISSKPNPDNSGGVRVDSGDGKMTATGVNSENETVANTNTGYQQGTNLQAGIDTGMKILENATDTAGRTPIMIVLTDGVADYGVNTDWYNVTTGNMKHPSSNDLTPGIALSTLLNAAYHKAMVEDVYGTTPIVYGVGVDLEDASEAHSLMDPKTYFTSDSSFSDVRTAYTWYTQWVSSNTTVSQRSNNYTWTFAQLPSTATVTKADVIANINYVDTYYNVGSTELETKFDEIYGEISKYAAESPITDTVVRGEIESSVPLTFVDFVGEYMEVKEFKAVTIFGETYEVTEGTTTYEDSTVDGITTRTTTTAYTVGNNEIITNPVLDVTFNITESVTIELIETCTGKMNGTDFVPGAVGEQEVWIYIAEDALPLWYASIETINGVVTYNYDKTADPVRVYYTVDVTSEILYPNGTVNLNLVDQAYINAHTVTDAETGEEKVYFYTNTYSQMNDHKEHLSASYTADEYGDAHASAMIAESNRYYYHQYNHVIYSSVTAKDGSAVDWSDETNGSYGLLYYQGNGEDHADYEFQYNVNKLTYADVVSMNENDIADSEEYVYVTIGFYRPKGTVSGESGSVEGEAVSYLVRATWEEMKVDTAFYDTVNGVYINGVGADGSFVVSEKEGYAVDPDVIAQYLAATSNVAAKDIEVYFGLGSWRIARLKLMTSEKAANLTETAELVFGPTYNEDSIHVGNIAVWLGNNGRLAATVDTTKTVDITDGTTGTTITDQDGNVVMVGDKLTYNIKVVNNEGEAATATVTDKVPTGTKLISISDGGTVTDSVITWNLSLAADETKYVSFTVEVTEDVLNSAMLTIDNTATIQVGNSPAYDTNTVKNPPEGKKVVGASTDVNPEDGVKVGQQLTYYIYFYNDKETEATITITDVIPEGTIYVENSADHEDKLTISGTTLTWVFENVQSKTGGVVSFDVKVAPSAQTPLENGATIKVGNDDPEVTNKTQTTVLTGDLVLSKEVTNGVAGSYENKEFTLVLTIVAYSDWNRTFNAYRNVSKDAETVTFENGVANVTIKHGDIILIKDIPADTVLNVTEPNPGTGYSATITNNGIVTIPESDTASVAVIVTNNYQADPAELVIGGTKKFTNNDVYENTQKFSFELKETTGGIASQAVELATDAEITAAAGETATETFNFQKLTYTTTGTHFYQLVEINSGISGVKYDTAVYDLKVEVTDDGSGQLTAKVYYDSDESAEVTWTEIDVTGNTIDLEALEFENTYAPLRETLTMVGKKTLNNAVLTDNQFSFIVTENGNTVATGQSKADGSIVFTTITYTAAGTHIYTIEEVTGAPNMSYGNEKYYIKVVVTEDKANAVLTKAVYSGTSTDPNGTWTKIENLTDITVKDGSILAFTNTYIPDDYSIALEGTKKLIGRDMAADEFDFIVVDKATGEQVSTGSNEAADNGVAGDIIFQPISYKLSELGNDKTETYTYVVSEVNEGKDGIGYSTASYEVMVKISYDDSTGWSKEITYPDGGVYFENTFTPPGVPVTISIPVNKTINSVSGGDIPADLTFGFKAVKAANAVDASGNVIDDGYSVGDLVGTGISAAPGDDKSGSATVTVAFTEMNFYKAGVYKCLLLETNAGKNLHGVEYSSACYLMVITVTQDQDTGLLSAVPTYYPLTLKDGAVAGSTNLGDYVQSDSAVSELNFENVYKAVGTLVVKAKKALTGRNLAASAGLYDFTLTGADGTVHTGTNDAEGNIVFDTLNFEYVGFDANDEKVLTYTMEEVEGKLPGIKYDSTTYNVTVYLKHIGEGKISASYTVEGLDGNIPKFTNVGSVYQGTSTTVEITKTLTGRDMAAGEFSFEMTYVGMMENGVPVEKTKHVEDTTLVNSASDGVAASVSLDVSISAAEGPGIYVFDIAEVNNNLGGVTYDKSVYRVVIEVADTNSDGVLEVVSQTITQIKNAEGKDITPESVAGVPAFENTYKTSSIDVVLEAYKKLTGRALNADEFDFKIFEIGSNGVEHAEKILKATGSNAADGKITFTPITIVEEGTYEYEVVELTTNLPPGVSATGEKYAVKVAVTDNGVGGLEAEVEVGTAPYVENPTSETAQIVFTNTYDSEDTTLKLTGTKKLKGRDMAAGEFAFNVNLIKVNDTAVSPAQQVAVGSNAAAADGAEATIDFSVIPYTAAGVYTYQIVEADPAANKVDKDSSVFEVVVTVEDTNAAKLTVTDIDYTRIDGETRTEVDGIAFENTYTPDPTKAVISVSKSLDGKPLEAEEFTFKLTEDEKLSGDNVDEAILVKNAKGGIVTFPKLIFTEKGEYTYTISEVVPATNPYEGTMTYAASQKVTVSVTDDGQGNLTAKLSYGDTLPVFYNGFVPDEIPVLIENTLDVSKELPERALVDDEFSFSVKNIQGIEVATGLNKADGSIVFDYNGDADGLGTGLKFHRTGIYRYSISEVAETNGGVTYDQAVWYVEFEILQDPVTGGLYLKNGVATVIEVVNSEKAISGNKVVFVNHYDAEDAEVILHGQKLMTGNRTDVKDGEFTFQLIDAEGNIAAEGKTDATGKITFGKMTFDKVSTNVYTLVEVVGTDKGITYNINNTEYEVQIDVVEKMDGDNYAGELVANVTINDVLYDGTLVGANAQIQFTNLYEPAPVEVALSATKVLEGKELSADQFAFELLDEIGNQVDEATNDAAGSIAFEALEFVEEGTYTYTMSEVKGSDSNIIYDKSVYTIVITVTDNKQGNLIAEVSYATIDGAAPIFTNTYAPPSVPVDPDPEPSNPKVLVQLEGTKTLKGGTMTDGQFKFEIHLSDGTPCGSGTSKADGTIAFYEMAFDTVGKHVLVITEVNDGQTGITYDSRKFEVIVDVYNHYGTLKANVYYPEGGIAFVNTTGAHWAPDTGDDSPIMLILAALLVCGGGLGGLLVWRRKREQEN